MYGHKNQSSLPYTRFHRFVKKCGGGMRQKAVDNKVPGQTSLSTENKNAKRKYDISQCTHTDHIYRVRKLGLRIRLCFQPKVDEKMYSVQAKTD